MTLTSQSATLGENGALAVWVTTHSPHHGGNSCFQMMTSVLCLYLCLCLFSSVVYHPVGFLFRIFLLCMAAAWVHGEVREHWDNLFVGYGLLLASLGKCLFCLFLVLKQIHMCISRSCIFSHCFVFLLICSGIPDRRSCHQPWGRIYCCSLSPLPDFVTLSTHCSSLTLCWGLRAGHDRYTIYRHFFSYTNGLCYL